MPIVNYNQSLVRPGLCTASSQAFSVSAFRWRIQDARTTWPETHRPRDRWKSKKKSLFTYKVSNTFIRVPNRVLQSRNLEPNFAQSRNPDSYFRNPVSPYSFNPESHPRFALKFRILSFTFIREIPHPGKPISDTVWYNFALHVLKHGKTTILNSNFSDVSFTPIWCQQLGFFGINIQQFFNSVLRFHFFLRGNRYLMFWRKFAIGKIFVALQTTRSQLFKRCIMRSTGLTG